MASGASRQDLHYVSPFRCGSGRRLAIEPLLLLMLLIKAKIRIMSFSALGFFLLLLQALVFLAVSGVVVLACNGLMSIQLVGGPGAGTLTTESILANNEP